MRATKGSYNRFPRGCIVLAKVFMEGDRLFQRVGAVCWKEWFEILRIDMCGQSSVRYSDSEWSHEA